LLAGCCFGAAIDLGHKEYLFSITIAQSLAHTDFAFSAVIVPTVIHERDTLIDGAANQLNTLIFVRLLTDVITAEPNH
jgi:hypothetical protein